MGRIIIRHWILVVWYTGINQKLEFYLLLRPKKIEGLKLLFVIRIYIDGGMSGERIWVMVPNCGEMKLKLGDNSITFYL